MPTKRLPPADLLQRFFVYDRETGQLINRVDRGNVPAGEAPGRVKTLRNGFKLLEIAFHGRKWPAHRLIWKLVTGQEPPARVRHRDGDGLNNRWLNLCDAEADGPREPFFSNDQA